MKICFAELTGIKRMKDFNLTDEMADYYNQRESDQILLASNKSKNEIKNMLMKSPFLIKEIGNMRMRHLKNNSYFILSTDHMEHEHRASIDKLYEFSNDAMMVNRAIDNYYDDMLMAVQNLSILFSTGMWLVKDSNIQPMYVYVLTSVNNYISAFNIKLDYSSASGRNIQIDITENDLENCKKMMKLLYEPLLDIQNSQNKKPTTTYISDSRYFEVNKNLSTINPSFTKTLMLIQEARNASFLPSKIDKYIAAIQCIFAVKDNFTFNCSRITAAYITKNNSERTEIMKHISDGYYIRSQFSHGKKIDEISINLEKTSIRLDSYMRRIMKKVLTNSELNYFTSEEEQQVRMYFKEIGRENFKKDYDELKQNNRLVGIKKNIEGIKDLDSLIDLEELIKQQMELL